MTALATDIAPAPPAAAGRCATPEQVLESIVDGINTRNLEGLMTLYESGAAFAAQPGSLAHGLSGVREGLAAFIAMKGTLDLKVTRVLEASGWPSSSATGHSQEPGPTVSRCG